MSRQSIARWMFEMLDRLGKISPGASGERIRRAQVQVGMCVLVLLLIPPLLLSTLVQGSPNTGLMMIVGVGVAHLLALALIRERRNALAAWVVCITLNSSLIFCGVHQDGLPFLVSPIGLIAPSLAIYLLGARSGVLFTTAVVVEIVAGYALQASGNVLQSNIGPANPNSIVVQLAVQAALLVGVLGWLHSQAHEGAHRALKSSAQTLRESEANLVSLIDNTSDMVCLIDMEFRLIRSNAAMRAFVQRHGGKTLTEGLSIFEMIRIDRRPRWWEHVTRALGGEVVSFDEVIETPNGPQSLEHTIARVWSADGRPIGLTLFARDVTARKAADARLLEAQVQLRHAQKLQAIGTLTAGIAHEINNPLSFVISNLECLKEELLDLGGSVPPAALAELLECHADASMGSDRIKRIVNDIRAFSRCDSETLKPIDVAEAVRQALKITSAEVGAAGVVVAELRQVSKVMASEHSLMQVLVNLIVNASQALPAGVPGNRVQVSTREATDGRVTIEVKDNGAGMSPAVRERIFEPFFTTKPVGQGTGLGLPICHGIVSRLGGEIEVESELGKGTTMRLLLPPVAPRAPLAA